MTGKPQIAGSQSGDACSIASTLAIIGDRWTLLVLRDIFRGVRRFSQLQADLGIAKNILSDRLQKLMDHGVIEQVPYQERPLRNEYHLTAKGVDLSPSLVALMHWGDRWYAEGGAPTVLVHAQCGTALEQTTVCPACEAHVKPGDIRSRPGPGRAEPDKPVPTTSIHHQLASPPLEGT